MGKLNIFEICYANVTGVYYAGQIIEGHVLIELNQSMRIRGEAVVCWTESKEEGVGDKRHTVTDWYTASEKYFDQDMLLFGIWPMHGNYTQELAADRYTFPFRFQLPLQLPSSFEDSIGYVRYIINCKIDIPWKFDHKTKRPFTVIGVLDLNQIPGAAKRLKSTKEKTLCCLCCKSGPIQATFFIERAGYVPGEAIKLYAEISNGSSRRINKSYIDLKMVKTFHAIRKSITDRQEVAKIVRPSIPARNEDVWSGEQIIVPPLPPSYLQGCKIIDIKYIIKLHVDPSGPSRDLEVPLEVIIGSIPLRFVVERNPPMSPPTLSFDKLYQWNLTPAAPPLAIMYPPPPGNQPSSARPSYVECITGQHSIRDKDDNEFVKGQLNYAPVYPYYNWGHTTRAIPS